MLKFVTSLNDRLFGEYGQRFIEGWREKAGDDIHLTVYCEGGTTWFPAELKSSKITVAAIESDAYHLFRAIYGRFFEANGRMVGRAPAHAGQYVFHYNYRFDALRFCFKAFSYLQELSRDLTPYSHLAWIDADVVCKKFFSAADLSPMLPHGGFVASYLGRTAFPPQAPHSECGFVGYDLQNPLSIKFLESFIDEYTTGKLFLNSEWHDSFIFDQVRLRFEAQGARFHNISGTHHAAEHPFILSELGTFFDHLKGPVRKSAGHS